jgi:hypothetical protein
LLQYIIEHFAVSDFPAAYGYRHGSAAAEVAGLHGSQAVLVTVMVSSHCSRQQRVPAALQTQCDDAFWLQQYYSQLAWVIPHCI